MSAPIHQHGEYPAKTVGVEVVQTRHGKPEPHAERRRRHRDHRPGQEAERDAVDGVVQHDELASGNFLKLIVERQPHARRDRRGHERPAQHGEQIADEQAHHEVDGTHARRHEQRADHQLRARRVFAGVLADETAEAELRLRWDGFAFVFRVFASHGFRYSYCFHLTSASRPTSAIRVCPVSAARTVIVSPTRSTIAGSGHFHAAASVAYRCQSAA